MQLDTFASKVFVFFSYVVARPNFHFFFFLGGSRGHPNFGKRQSIHMYVCTSDTFGAEEI